MPAGPATDPERSATRREGTVIDYFTAFSWPWSDNQKENAQQFFDALHTNKDACPFKDNTFEVSLAKSMQGNVFVGVLALPGTSHDDSVEIFNKLKEWFAQSSAGSFEDYNGLPVCGRSTDGTLGSAYQVLAYFGTIRGSKGATSPKKPEDKGEPRKPWWKFW